MENFGAQQKFCWLLSLALLASFSSFQKFTSVIAKMQRKGNIFLISTRHTKKFELNQDHAQRRQLLLVEHTQRTRELHNTSTKPVRVR